MCGRYSLEKRLLERFKCLFVLVLMVGCRLCFIRLRDGLCGVVNVLIFWFVEVGIVLDLEMRLLWCGG